MELIGKTTEIITGLNAVADLTLPDTGVVLNWNANTEFDSAYYNIYRDTTSAGNYYKINSAPVYILSYFDSEAKQGDSYYYAVTCVDRYNNESLKSDSVSAAHLLMKKIIYSITISGNTIPPIPGAVIEYLIEFVNNGFAPAYNIILTDSLPQEVSYKVSSAECVSGDSITVLYSNNNTIDNFTYIPSGIFDDNVTDIKFVFNNFISPKIDWPASVIVKYKVFIK